VQGGSATMRSPITLRLDADLLAAARVEAKRDSRTLTNLIEVALKRHLAGAGTDRLGPGPGPGATGGLAEAGAPAGGARGRQP
jgi:hypothetical protein